MQPFTTILFIDNCPVEYRVSSTNGPDMLLFTPIQMEDHCESPPIFYVVRKDDKWAVLNMPDQDITAQVLEKLYIQHVE